MFEIWIKAITGPTEENYLSILKSGDASFGTAAMWMVVAGIISGIVTGAAAMVFESPMTELGIGAGALFIIYPIIIIFSFFIGSGIYYITAKALGGKGDFGAQSYLLAAGQAPLNIITAVLAVIPVLGQCVSGLVSLYVIYLNILSVKTAHGFDWGKAVATVLIPLIVIFILACGCIFILALSGAAIGGVFEEIVRELEAQ